VNETFVADVAYSEEYPYDTVTFESALTATQQKTGVGGNLQADIISMVSRHLGIDGLVRFSYASLKFAGAGGSALAVPAGGLHVGIGIRAEF